MKWVPRQNGRFAQRPHYLPEELDAECERVILSFLNKKYGKVEFPIKTDDLTVFIEEQADLDSYADLSGEGDHVEGVTEFLPGKRPVVRITDALNAAHLENRLRTTLTHEYGHVHFHRFMFEDLKASPHRFSAMPTMPRETNATATICVNAPRTRLDGMAGRIRLRGNPDADGCPGGCSSGLPRREQSSIYSNLSLQSDTGQKLITTVASAFQTSRDAARVRLLKKGILTDSGSQPTKDLF